MRLARHIVLSFLLLAGAAWAAAPASKLNQQAIHQAYNEGDFDKVVVLIDGFTKENKTYLRSDSIFIAKHLAVVYSANPPTREKGRFYMYRLLEMMPSAELVDMFVSDEIDRIFEKVRKEFVTRQRGFGVDSTDIAIPEKPAARDPAPAPANVVSTGPSAATPSKEKPAPSNPFWTNKVFWIAGGTGLIATGAVAYFVHSQEEATGKTITIPDNTVP